MKESIAHIKKSLEIFNHPWILAKWALMAGCGQ